MKHLLISLLITCSVSNVYAQNHNSFEFDNVKFNQSNNKNEYLKKVITTFQEQTKNESLDGEYWMPKKACENVVSYKTLNEARLVIMYQVKCSNFKTDVVVDLGKQLSPPIGFVVESCRYYGEGRPKSEQCKK